ncbi:MAG: hypothetical protein M5U07_25325 [Xanthobacteraceae bacterium]|nr:hypothetical protein [Xanthobacteraceae bacterium]PWB59723.1 MAG: hypothetical protein C3F17_16295 [Bradyrhizobiaceae bacterium]
MRPLSHYFDPGRWQRFAAGQIEVMRRRRGDDRLDAFLAELGPVRHATGEGVVIADAMYHSPNHYFRLRMFVEALAARGEAFRLLGLLRRKDDLRPRRALERIGFSEFFVLEDDGEHRAADFTAEADALLSGAASHADLLALRLPHDLPAYVWYDTALKVATHPQPPLDHPVWRTTLAETLRNLAIHARELARRRVAHVVLSHPWKSEWAALVWLALGSGVPVHYVTSHTEGLRVRRFRSRADYLDPVEHLPYRQFAALDPQARARLAALGHAAFARRASGQSTDINARSAYRPDLRIADRRAARLALSGQAERPAVLVLGHVWYDFPHSFGMTNFTDFLDWTQVTLAAIHDCREAVWLLKPHPTERWYGRFFLAQVARDLPDHVRLLPIDTDAATAFAAADAVVTVHGTGGLEAVAAGVPAIFADRSYYSDWDLGAQAASREDYVRLLRQAHRLPAPDRDRRDRAAACFALSVGEPPPETGALRISCDSLGSRLYDEIMDRWSRDPAAIRAERDRLAAFLGQDAVDSFAAYHLTRTLADVRPVDRMAWT